MSDENKVMVAIPTNKVKHYCLAKLVVSLNNLEGADRIVFVDDTRNDDDQLNLTRGSDLDDGNQYRTLLSDAGFEVHEVTETTSAPAKPRILQRLVNARNKLRDIFLASDCTHMLFIDSDVMVPSFTIPALLSANTDIITGIYWQQDRDGQARPVIYKFLDTESWTSGLGTFGMPLTIDDMIPSRIVGEDFNDIHITAIGFGCVLISRKVLEDKRWKFRYDTEHPEKHTTEDMWWSIDMFKLGYPILCHTGIMCKHYPKAWVGPI